MVFACHELLVLVKDEWRMISDIFNIHKSHPSRSFGLYMFHYFNISNCFNISKHISISVLFFIISVSCVVFFAGVLKIIAPGVGF